MAEGYTVAICLEWWPTQAPLQIQRDFDRRMTAAMWGRFSYDPLGEQSM